MKEARNNQRELKQAVNIEIVSDRRIIKNLSKKIEKTKTKQQSIKNIVVNANCSFRAVHTEDIKYM